MLATTKLTKRQKKGIAFRERQQRKSKDKAPGIADSLEDEIDVPSFEDQALVLTTQGQQGHQASEETFLGRGKGGTEGEEAEAPVVGEKKRKRKTSEEAKGPSNEPKAKRGRGFDRSSLDGMEQPVSERDHVGYVEAEKTKQRFILFLGNLKYTTTPEAIQAHFSTCIPPPTVRLLTPKPSMKSPTKSVTKSKGCAFLEFKYRSALQQGLKLHHSMLDGRQINVELTAGGGGKGSARMKKLKERNKHLEGQRRKRQEPKTNAQSGGTQHFSTTSGAGQTHVHKRTWSIGDVEERETHRGGQKLQERSKQRGFLAKEFRTGVNAIPVG